MANERTFNYAVSVGAMLADDLQAMAMTQKELSERTGITRSVINEIIKGKRKITTEIALKFEDVFGMPASYWLNLQSDYDIAKRREETYLIVSKGTIKTGKYHALDIAHWFIRRSLRDVGEGGEYMTPLKLQKVLYIAQERSLKETNSAIFREPILNWGYGPVVNCVYQEYKALKANPITEAPEPAVTFDVQTEKLLEKVYRFAKPYSASGLVTITHKRSDWQDTERGEEIPLELIRDAHRVSSV